MIKRSMIILLLSALPAWGAMDTVSLLFAEGDYQGARDSLEEGQEGLRAGEATLWAAQLSTDPEEALRLLREGLDDSRLPEPVKIRMTRELADIEFGLGRYQSSLKTLAPLLGESEAGFPGSIYLRAGLSLRALGNLQKAREMLASVKPLDPAFMLARYYLGDIALEQNDSALALRYFESASGIGSGARIAGGKWRAYQAENRDLEATNLEQELSRSAPGSLALLEIQRLRRERDEELEAMIPPTDSDAGSADQAAPRGRYTLQLGAFSDRGLALDFLRRHRPQLPDLRIDEVRDQRGQFLYKVRTGSFVNPALAKTEAKRLANTLDLEVIVADLSDSGNQAD